jgi:DNA polymerase III alpha subunit (gram-positive type)
VFSAVKAVNKKRQPENQMKIIYGSEMNIIDDDF